LLKDLTRITYISGVSLPNNEYKNYSSVGGLDDTSSFPMHALMNSWKGGTLSAVGNQVLIKMVTASSLSTIPKKPTLFKSSKYAINKTEESHKD
jgi:hypothetical protein